MENISVYTVVNFYFSSDGVTWSSGTQITAAALSCGQINIGGCIDPNSSGGVIGISTSTPAGGVYYQLS
jgi:hypothetical protein